jgi:hypothetical protein
MCGLKFSRKDLVDYATKLAAYGYTAAAADAVKECFDICFDLKSTELSLIERVRSIRGE